MWPFSLPLRSHWLSDSEQRAADWAQGPVEKGKSGEGRRISGLMPTSGHSSMNCCKLSVAQLSAALSHEWRLASGWDYSAVVAPLWSDTLSFLAHREKEAKG